MPNFETLTQMGLGDQYQSWVDADDTLHMAQAQAEKWMRQSYIQGRSPADIAESIGLAEHQVRSVLTQYPESVGSNPQWPFMSSPGE